MTIARTPGKLIVFEGPDGVGKTTHAQKVAEQLNAHNIPAMYLYEPGSTVYGDAVRELLKNPDIPLTSTAQALAFLSVRSQLVETEILPNMIKGIHIILDRYTPSTVAYQSEVGADILIELEEVFKFPTPDLYIFLEADKLDLVERLQDKELDRFETLNITRLGNLVSTYHDLSYMFCGTRVWNGSEKTVESVHTYIMESISYLLNK